MLARRACRRATGVQMRDRLADREESLLQVERTAEQRRHDVGRRNGRRRRRNRGEQFIEARRVMRAQLRSAQRDAPKRQAVRRQHQRIGRQRVEGGQRIEKAA
jgi:hypothetical protein